MRREQGRRRPRSHEVGFAGQQRQPVGVDDDGQIGREDGAHPLQCVVVGTDSRSDHPCLDAAGRRDVGRRDDLGAMPDDRRGVRPCVPDHARRCSDGTARAEDPGARISGAAGDHTDDPLGVLVVVRARDRPHLPDVRRVELDEPGVAALDADRDEFDAPAHRRGERVHAAQQPEGDRDVRADRGSVDGARVAVDATRQVHRDDRGAHLLDECRRGTAQPALARDPEDPVDHEVDVVGQRAGGDAPSRTAQCRRSRRVHPFRIDGAGGDDDAAATQQRAGPQRVTAVVPRPDEQPHRPAHDSARARAQFVGHDPRDAVRRTAHERPLGKHGELRRLGVAHLRRRVVPAHPPASRRASTPLRTLRDERHTARTLAARRRNRPVRSGHDTIRTRNPARRRAGGGPARGRRTRWMRRRGRRLGRLRAARSARSDRARHGVHAADDHRLGRRHRHMDVRRPRHAARRRGPRRRGGCAEQPAAADRHVRGDVHRTRNVRLSLHDPSRDDRDGDRAVTADTGTATRRCTTRR
ncbi:hypothetical protein Rrhod_0556 [Rhodococcus rhodnii LMG 5362]|uniref:Uncharacterized protein n=1 Tax=Rhodococcus rhodnii LMG 5362 TaxID=1273125 RepID=R7WRV3_9NOCA|nr:hypothetical protein Rrhod_0556 [Rhodococcus rhodnii LMG 5362]